MQTFQIHSSLIPSLRSGIINEPTFERTDKFENGYKFIFGNIVHETSIINWDRLKIGINNFLDLTHVLVVTPKLSVRDQVAL